MRVELTGVDAFNRILDRMGEFNKRQAPYAMAVALNSMVNRIGEGERDVMAQRFDRPTPYTLNSIRKIYTDKRKLSAYVGLKDEAYKAIPASKFLEAQILGGPRGQKRSERMLANKGLAKFWTPAPEAQLDGYGNVGRGFILKMLSALKAHGEVGYLANRNEKSKRSAAKAKNFDVFIGAPNGQDVGVWQRINRGKNVKPLMWMSREAPKYRKLFPFEKVAKNIWAAHAESEIERAIRHAIATAINK